MIIPNHNYADYVGIAIKSALEIRWPKVEVIVVDDGSTDNSLEVIGAFADKITLISQENAGQMPSCVNGFRRCSGDVVIFLDFDDALHGGFPRRISRGGGNTRVCHGPQPSTAQPEPGSK